MPVVSERTFVFPAKLDKPGPKASLEGSETRWTERSAGLEYQFGGRKITEVRFRARVSMVHFTDPPGEPADADALVQLADCSLARMYSHPVDVPLPRLAFLGRSLRYVPRHYKRGSVATDGSFEQYLAAFSAKTRQTLKRKVRKYCDIVGSQTPWQRFAGRAELQRFHTLAREISVRTYQERLFDAGLPVTTEYLDEAFSDGHDARGYLLFDGSIPVAYLFTPVEQGIALYKFLGYDPRYAAWSPGSVLQYFALESMFADPAVSLLDFAEGEAPHKALFARSETYCADIYYFRTSLRTVAAVSAHLAVGAIDRVLSDTLSRIGLRRRIQRFIRR